MKLDILSQILDAYKRFMNGDEVEDPMGGYEGITDEDNRPDQFEESEENEYVN